MKSPSLGNKPSQQHIVWTSGGEEDIKRFHEDYLKQWCQHFDFDFETYKRTDHERSGETRRQYQCVFSYQEGAGDSFEMNGEEWAIETDKTPRTFIEIDEEGVMRAQGWSVEKIIDVVELWHEGPELLVESRGKDNRMRLDAADLTQ